MQPDFRFRGFIIILLMSLCVVQVTSAQFTEDNFVGYTAKEGLSDNNVTCIQQDDRGYIWIGTDAGLNRFDGFAFQKYYQDNPEHFLTSSRIVKIVATPAHQLIVATSKGVQLVNTLDFSIQQRVIPDSTAFTSYRNFVMDVLPFHNHSLGVTTASGFYVFNNTGQLTFRHDAYGIQDIGNKRILYGKEMYTLPDDEVLVYVEAAKQALYSIQEQTFREFSKEDESYRVFCHPSYEDHWISKAQISEHEFVILPHADSIIYYDFNRKTRVASPLPFHWREEFFWGCKLLMLDSTQFIINGNNVGFRLFHIDRHSGQITCDPKKYLDHTGITSFFLDKEHRLWIGTHQGLLRQKLKKDILELVDRPITVSPLSEGAYVDAFAYKDKLYLARNSNEYGLVILDRASMNVIDEIQFFNHPGDWNYSMSLQMYYPDTLWIGTTKGILWFDTKTNQYGIENFNLRGTPPAFSILAPPRKDGYAWMCQYLEGLVGRYNLASRTVELFSDTTNPRVPFNRIKHIAYDSYGDVWFGGHSLARWNNKLQVFDTIMTQYGGPNKYNDDILLLQADDLGSLWLHNVSNGLLQYNIQSHVWNHRGMREGLPSDDIVSISPLIDGSFWFTDPNHLIHFDTHTSVSEYFDWTDGLPEGNSTGRYLYFDDEDKKVYAFFKNKVGRFSPDHKPVNAAISGVFFEQISAIEGRTIFFPGAKINLSPTEKNLLIQYTVLDFENASQYKFGYRLNGHGEWHNLGQQHTLNLINLSAGDYVLEINATGNSGIIKSGKLSFSIAPPFWQNTWFFIACWALLSGVLFLLYRWRIMQFRQRANLDKLLAQTEMKALHAQMNPHFIFNSLNSIREMILNNENHEASRFLSKFAHLIRITLDQSRQPAISLRNSIDYINRYVEMEKIRNSRFQFSMRSDPNLELDETILPPMLIQPFIENAIWHGTNGDGKMIDIKVLFQKRAKQLVCIIEDNGIGIDHSLKNKNQGDQHQSIGIANIKNRIDLLNQKYDMRSTITVEDKGESGHKDASGTLVTITLPLEMTEL